MVGLWFGLAMADPRFLELVGVNNARDLGGLPTGDGRLVRPRRILRSDFLVNLGPEDERLLLGELGLRLVVDLRTVGEVERFPGPWGDVGVDVVQAALPLDPAFVARRTEDMTGLYLAFAEPPATALALALEAVLDVDRHPVLVHCAAGKDRTGVLVALALELLGVERETIGLDYELTRERMTQVIPRLEAEAGRGRSSTLPEVMYGADPATIEGFLAGIEERHGGAAGWAREVGVDPAAIERFRAAMLD
jgi:protein-tyrosine phosphatase